MLENQFIDPCPKGSKLIFFAPLGVGVNEENQLGKIHNTFLVKFTANTFRVEKET
jgi:hypothetical protein